MKKISTVFAAFGIGVISTAISDTWISGAIAGVLALSINLTIMGRLKT